MQTTVTARHCEISEALRSRAVTVVERLGSLAPRPIESTVVFDADGLQQIAEIRLHLADEIMSVCRAFVKKKAEAGRELIQGALRGLTGRTPGLAFELSDTARVGGPATLEEAELIERLRTEFGAEEVFESDHEE